MKTIPLPDITPEFIDQPIHTSTKPKQPDDKGASDNTEVISFANVKNPPRPEVFADGPIKDLDCTVNFSFEKNRLKVLENSGLLNSMNITNVGVAIQMQVLKEAELTLREASARYQIIDLILLRTRTVAIVLVLVFVLEIIGTFFGILMVTILSVSASNYILFLSMEALTSLIFLFLSIKATGLNRRTIRNSQRIFKLYLILLVVLIGAFIINSHFNSFGSIVSRSRSKATGGKEKTVCIILICCYFFSIAKAIFTTGYITCWIIIQVILKRIDGKLLAAKN